MNVYEPGGQAGEADAVGLPVSVALAFQYSLDMMLDIRRGWQAKSEQVRQTARESLAKLDRQIAAVEEALGEMPDHEERAAAAVRALGRLPVSSGLFFNICLVSPPVFAALARHYPPISRPSGPQVLLDVAEVGFMVGILPVLEVDEVCMQEPAAGQASSVTYIAPAGLDRNQEELYLWLRPSRTAAEALASIGDALLVEEQRAAGELPRVIVQPPVPGRVADTSGPSIKP